MCQLPAEAPQLAKLMCILSMGLLHVCVFMLHMHTCQACFIGATLLALLLQVWSWGWPPGPSSAGADPNEPNYVLHTAPLLIKYPNLTLELPQEVEWMMENPGQQGRLTGSFHPLEGTDWTQQAYARWASMCCLHSVELGLRWFEVWVQQGWLTVAPSGPQCGSCCARKGTLHTSQQTPVSASMVSKQVSTAAFTAARNTLKCLKQCCLCLIYVQGRCLNSFEGRSGTWRLECRTDSILLQPGVGISTCQI